MTEYWQSLDKKFCDTCKCWLSDNRSSIEFHENGKRHKENIQKRLSDIQKKTRKQEKDDKKTNRDMRKIEEAAAAAYSMDAANPDITRKIELYREEMEKESGGGTTGVDGEDTKKNSKKDGKDLLPKPKILHREEKPNKNSSTTATPSYTSKGGWTNLGHTSGGLDLELPPKNVPLHPKIFAEKTKRSKPSSASNFEEGTLISHDKYGAPGQSTTSQSETSGSTEVVFKKRKFARSNMRQRDDD